jgi:hypothetical protein
MRYERTVFLRTLKVHAQKCISGSTYEIPRGLLNQRQSDLVGQGVTEKAIALDLARDVALKTASPFPAIGERAAGLYDEDPPIWYEYRHRVILKDCRDDELFFKLSSTPECHALRGHTALWRLCVEPMVCSDTAVTLV